MRIYPTEDLLLAIQRKFPYANIVPVDRGYNYAIFHFPVDDLYIKIKPGASGLFQVKFPFFANTRQFDKFNDYSMLDEYFEKNLHLPFASNFDCQIRSNKLIYIYPRYIYKIDECVEVLDYIVQFTKKSVTKLYRSQSTLAVDEKQPINSGSTTPSKTHTTEFSPFQVDAGSNQANKIWLAIILSCLLISRLIKVLRKNKN